MGWREDPQRKGVNHFEAENPEAAEKTLSGGQMPDSERVREQLESVKEHALNHNSSSVKHDA